MVRERGRRSDSDIVHVNSYDRPSYGVFRDDIFVDLIHHRLEGCGGITQAKKHDCGLKESIACFEGCFMFVAFFDANIIVPPSNVKFRENGSATEVGDEIGDEGERVLVAYSETIDSSIILYWAQFSIFLFY